jgi:putative nucleotidyltransferase with HDIG domain
MFNSRSASAYPVDAHPAERTIAPEDLRVGMFIHLDGGWLSHPFARSSFRIANAQQIATLRGLKLSRVRWSPELSDSTAAGGGSLPVGAGAVAVPAGTDDLAAADPSGSAGASGADAPAAMAPRDGAGAAATADAAAPDHAATTAAQTATPNAAQTAAPTATPTATQTAAGAPAAIARHRPGPGRESATPRAAELAAERHAQQQCERQFAEAAGAWRAANESLPAHPAAARAGAGALADALTDKLMTDGEVGIRLLPCAGNDRPAAHALNVTVVSMLLGRSLGLPREDLAELALGALLHDVGKLELPERVRHIEAGCSAAETHAYREHVARGVATARRMELPEGALAVIAQHHEHADATGFPTRMTGDRMSLAGRIVAIVNRYDNLCNPATRTPPLTPHEAVAMLFAHGRTRYDASVLNAFIRMMGVYPAGSLVQLTDERYAMVVAVNSTRPLKPRVLVHEHGVPRNEALLLDLEREPDIGIRRSLAAAKVPSAALQYLDPRPRVAYFFESLAAAAGASTRPAREMAAA